MWNITDKAQKRETRFTGWADVPLSARGRLQAVAAGSCLANLLPDISYDVVFTSVLSRSLDTYNLIAEQMSQQQHKSVRHVATWRLNERHYGSLVGLSKSQAETKLGKERVMGWRRSWDLKPPPMDKDPRYYAFQEDSDAVTKSKEPLFDWQSDIWTKAITVTRKPSRYDGSIEETIDIDTCALIPKSESLQDTAARVLPLWKEDIQPRLMYGQTVMVVAHSNTIRSMIKHLDNITPESITRIVIPSAIPLIYSFDDNPFRTTGVPSGVGMTGRFVVTKELLQLSMQASQHLEMSENLDHSENFKEVIAKSLEDINLSSSSTQIPSNVNADVSLLELAHSDNNVDHDVDALIEEYRLKSRTVRQTKVMERGWMTFDIQDSV